MPVKQRKKRFSFFLSSFSSRYMRKQPGLEVPYQGKLPTGVSGPFTNHPAKPGLGEQQTVPFGPQSVRGPAQQPGAALARWGPEPRHSGASLRLRRQTEQRRGRRAPAALGGSVPRLVTPILPAPPSRLPLRLLLPFTWRDSARSAAPESTAANGHQPPERSTC